jgi:signal transduction histidine kinase
MKRSLALKWSVTLLLSSLTGVFLVGLFAYRTTLTEFDRLRVEQARTTLIATLTSYYQTHGSWEGVDSWQRQNERTINNPPQPGNPPLRIFALADANGVIVLGSGPFHLRDQVSPSQLEQGTPVTLDDKHVGTLLVSSPPPGLDPREQLYLNRTNLALSIGAIGASAVALLIGILLSRQFLRPLTELRDAITAMRRGDLNQQVQVRTKDELGDLAAAFNQMSARIHRANQLRQQMTADVAHDLRTPLLVITGYLEGLSDGTLKATPERIAAMQREALLLQRLIEDLRTLSLADAGELKLICQPVKPWELLQQVRQSFEPMVEQQQVALTVQADEALPELRLDRERMVQVLGNLVTNALRYTPAGGSVRLSAVSQPNSVQLTVQDTGTGIAPEKLHNIFERFYRVDESRHENAGESGLGLAIAKSIVESHGGTISATSQVGQGTTMTIQLPLQRMAENSVERNAA